MESFRMKVTLYLLCLGTLVSLSLTQEEELPVEEEEHVELFTTPTTKMAAATSDFGFNLFRALASRDASANIFLSPITISAALSQLSLGGSERAQRQLYRALRYHRLQDPQLHSTLKELLASLRTTGTGLSTAARIYLARRLRLKQDFFTLVESQYGVRPKALMGGAKDVKDINDWVRQETGGKVSHILSKPLPRNSGVNLLGAAHFKGKWVTRFDHSGVMKDFQLVDEAPVSIPMMQQDNYPMKIGIDSDLCCTIALIPMQGQVSMLVLLPDQASLNMSHLEEALTADFVQDLVNTLQPAHASLSLPHLQLSYTSDLLDLLPALGLSDWLQETDLEKVTSQAAKLSSVNHKVVMEMTPEGDQSAGPPVLPGNVAYRVDRPFLFLVRDDAAGALLLIGRIVNPKTLGR